jgi:hypothetical protein
MLIMSKIALLQPLEWWVLLMPDYLHRYLPEYLLFGALLGGANQAVLEMLEEIHRMAEIQRRIWPKPKIKMIHSV